MSTRATITKVDVVNAANALQAKGITPTANKVREKLKKGSFTTIQKMLEDWRGNPPASGHSDIPQDIHDHLATIASDLWQKAQAAANAALAQEREDLSQERVLLMKEVDKALVKAEIIQERVVEVEAHLQQAQRDATRYRQEVAMANGEVATLRKRTQHDEELMDELETTNERLSQQISEKDSRLADVSATERALRISYDDAKEQNARDKAAMERMSLQLDNLTGLHREATHQLEDAKAAASAAKDDKADALLKLELVEQRHRDAQKRHDKLNKLYLDALAKAATNDALTLQLSEHKAAEETILNESDELKRKHAEQTGQLTSVIAELRFAQRMLYKLDQRGSDLDQE